MNLFFLCFYLSSNLKIEETFIIKDSCLTIYLKNYPIIKNSETLYFHKEFIKKFDYFIDYEKGVIEIKELPSLFPCTVKITYFYLPFSKSFLSSPTIKKKVKTDSFFVSPSINETTFNTSFSDITFGGEKEIKLNYHNKEGINLVQQTNFSLNGNINEINFEGFFNGKENKEEGFSVKELDNSYLKMKTKNLFLTWGNQTKEIDFSHFGKFYSQGKGASLSQTNTYETLYFHYLTTPFKYEKIQFYGKDFIQGPYYLKRNKSIKILPNSERVFLDGKLLKRGNNEDYLIDYEFGFITFTNRWIITSRNFIEIDFLYEEEIYERDNYCLNLQTVRLPIKTNISYYWEKEKVKRELFDKETKNYLTKIGNDTARAFINLARYVGKNKGDYEKVDNIFLYVGENKGSYLVNFTFVGESVGDYEYDNIKNCYYYVGKNKGKYLPYFKINLPKENLFTLINFEIPFNENLNFQFGGIINKKDENILSPYGDTNCYSYGTNFAFSYHQEKIFWWLQNLNLFKNYQILSQLKNDVFINFPLKNKTSLQTNFFLNKDLSFLNKLELIKKEKDWSYFGSCKFNFFFNEILFKKDYYNKKTFTFSTSPIYHFFNPTYSFTYQRDTNNKYFLIHFFGTDFHFKESKFFLNYEIEREKEDLNKKKKIIKFGMNNKNNPQTSFIIGFLENSFFSDFDFNYSFKNLLYFVFSQKFTNEEEVIKEIRFIKVKKGEGNYSKDTLTNQYYPDSLGEYLKEIIPLRKEKRISKIEFNNNFIWLPIKKIKFSFSSNFTYPQNLNYQFLTDYFLKENLVINYKINYFQKENKDLIFEDYKTKKIENFFSIKKEVSKLLTLTGLFQFEKGEKEKREIYYQKEKTYGFFNCWEFKENYNLNLKPNIFFVYYQYLLPFKKDYLIKRIGLNLEENNEILKDFYFTTLLEIIYRIYPKENLPLELTYYEPKGISYNFSVLLTKKLNQNLFFNLEFFYLKRGGKERDIKINFSSRLFL